MNSIEPSTEKDEVDIYDEVGSNISTPYYPSKHLNKNIYEIKLGILNICCIKSKLYIPEFDEFLAKHDNISLCETKTDNADTKLVTDYMSDKRYDIYCKHRKKLSHIKSGGIVVCIKKTFKNHVEVITSDSIYVLWLRLDKQLFGTQKDVLFGSVYLPPEGSLYHNNLCIDSIEHDSALLRGQTVPEAIHNQVAIKLLESGLLT